MFFDVTIYFAPLFNAEGMKLDPSVFFPLIVKNILSFFKYLVSI